MYYENKSREEDTGARRWFFRQNGQVLLSNSMTFELIPQFEWGIEVCKYHRRNYFSRDTSKSIHHPPSFTFVFLMPCWPLCKSATSACNSPFTNFNLQCTAVLSFLSLKSNPFAFSCLSSPPLTQTSIQSTSTSISILLLFVLVYYSCRNKLLQTQNIKRISWPRWCEIEINFKKTIAKAINTWKLNNMPLNIEEVTEEIKTYLEKWR